MKHLKLIADALEININEIFRLTDGDYDVAYKNAVCLVKKLVSELNLSVDKVIRHYDATGKYCPRKMMDNPGLWAGFKNAIANEELNVVTTTTNANETIREWQEAAIQDGFSFPLFDADGKCGPKTKTEIISYQKNAV